MMEQIANKEAYITKTRDAMDAMTVGIIETLGLVIGLLAIHASTTDNWIDGDYRCNRGADRDHVHVLCHLEGNIRSARGKNP